MKIVIVGASITARRVVVEANPALSFVNKACDRPIKAL